MRTYASVATGYRQWTTRFYYNLWNKFCFQKHIADRMQTTVLDVNSYVYADGIPYTTTSNTIAACHITL